MSAVNVLMSATKNLKLKLIIPLLILFFAVSTSVLLYKSRPEAAIIENQEKIWSVSTIEATTQSIAPQVTLYGKIESPHNTQLTSAVNSEVKETFIKDGQSVTKNQILVKLDDKDYRLQLKQRQAELEEIQALIDSEIQRHENDQQALLHEQTLLQLAETEYKRAQSLERDRLATQSLIDNARQAVIKQQLSVNSRNLAVSDHNARLKQLQAKQSRAEAMRDLALLDVERTVVRSPFNAIVTKVYVSNGNRVLPGEALVDIYNSESLEVRAPIPTQYVSIFQHALQDKKPIFAYFQFDQSKIDLLLDRITSQVTKGSGTLDALFNISNHTSVLQIGRTFSLNVKLPEIDDVFMIPRSAIYGSDQIYVLHDGRMKSHKIRRVGEVHQDNKQYIIVKSLTLSNEYPIITTQLPNAVDGLRVKAVKSSS